MIYGMSCFEKIRLLFGFLLLDKNMLQLNINCQCWCINFLEKERNMLKARVNLRDRLRLVVEYIYNLSA
jgi:hypothetical protein